ncbi:hypothetical protein KA996_06215, partial [bacterium]|nr:hypothetical protein [bacterium]
MRNSAAFIIIFLFSSSCSTEDPAECITAFDCDEGLVCIDGYCVDDGIGNTGNTGNSGNSGNTGDSGDTGNTGNSGNSGNSGNTGDSGDTGNTGDTGNFGKDCKGIMTCIDECEPDDTSCLQDCY